jgi:superoxide dismutase, Cu-Zn family
MMRAMAAILLMAGTAAAQQPRVLTGASAELAKADGDQLGTARITPDGRTRTLRISISVHGLAPGRYGIHIHAVGRCEGPAFESAGPHWNPTARHHGRLNPNGPHLGDLPNLEVGADGRGRISFVVAHTLASLLDADGASVVLHAAADDERTDPSGNSGARVACGALRGYSS